MTLNAMIEKRKKLLNTMDGFLDTHKGVNGVLSKEDDAVYAEMEQEFKDLTTEIQRMQRREEMEREMNKPINTPITDAIISPRVHPLESPRQWSPLMLVLRFSSIFTLLE